MNETSCFRWWRLIWPLLAAVVGFLLGNLTGLVALLQILTGVFVFAFVVVMLVPWPPLARTVRGDWAETSYYQTFRRARVAYWLMWPTIFLVAWVMGAWLLTTYSVSIWATNAEAVGTLVGF